MTDYQHKYLAYKAKYFALKQKLSQNGGRPDGDEFGPAGEPFPLQAPTPAPTSADNFPRPSTPVIRTYETAGVGTDPIPFSAPAPTTTVKETKTVHHIFDPYYNPYLPALQYLQPKPYVRPYYEPAYTTDYLNYDPYEDKPRRSSRRSSKRRSSKRKTSKKSSKRRSRK